MLKNPQKNGIIVLSIIMPITRKIGARFEVSFMKKICKITIGIFVCLILLSTPCFALSFNRIESGVTTFEDAGKEKGEQKITGADVAPLVNGIASILLTIGVIVVLAGMLVVGIKYMVATPDEAAKLKTSFVGLAVSGVVIIGALGIWKLVRNFFNTV